jgi:hypothetical protein
MMKFVVAGVATLATAGGIGSYLFETHLEDRVIAVVSKERLMSISTNNKGGTSSSWTSFVYSSDETYVVADSLWNWHFRARTVYAQIKEGASCHVTLSGYRWGFLSTHQNIIAANCEGAQS